MVTTLTYISLFAGGILVLLLFLSILGGLDLDVDVGADVDTETGGGLGVIKGILTFLSVASWVIKVLLVNEQSTWLAVLIGIVAGVLAFMLLSYLLKLLLRNEENVNWSMEDALYQSGDVYLKIPKGGSGLVNVSVKGATREFKAKTRDNIEIKTGARIVVVEVEGEFVFVELESN